MKAGTEGRQGENIGCTSIQENLWSHYKTETQRLHGNQYLRAVHLPSLHLNKLHSALKTYPPRVYHRIHCPRFRYPRRRLHRYLGRFESKLLPGLRLPKRNLSESTHLRVENGKQGGAAKNDVTCGAAIVFRRPFSNRVMADLLWDKIEDGLSRWMTSHQRSWPFK